MLGPILILDIAVACRLKVVVKKIFPQFELTLVSSANYSRSIVFWLFSFIREHLQISSGVVVMEGLVESCGGLCLFTESFLARLFEEVKQRRVLDKRRNRIISLIKTENVSGSKKGKWGKGLREDNAHYSDWGYVCHVIWTRLHF